jgi:hypothetical protein
MLGLFVVGYFVISALPKLFGFFQTSLEAQHDQHPHLKKMIFHYFKSMK